MEPRRWSHLPTGTNFAGGGYAYTSADIALDPVLQIEGANMEMRTLVAGYIRTFELFEKSARIDIIQAHKNGRWEGAVGGVPTTIRRNGLADSVVRFAVNLYGAPPLKGKKYAAYRAKLVNETIAGTALTVQFPTGEYKNDKLINLGTNRFMFRPELGIVHSRGEWSFEITGAGSFYTGNDEFFNGSRLEQDPLYGLQGHIIYTFRPGLWAGASVGYEYGGQSTLNQVERNDRKENFVSGLSVGYAITRQWGIKAAYVRSRTGESVGADSDTIVIGLSTYW